MKTYEKTNYLFLNCCSLPFHLDVNFYLFIIISTHLFYILTLGIKIQRGVLVNILCFKFLFFGQKKQKVKNNVKSYSPDNNS
jgi:hypothetical protein